MAQGKLPFKYEIEKNSIKMTGIAGFMVFSDKIAKSRLKELIQNI